VSKAGCEERRRNHSYPIPNLNVLAGIPDIDSAEYSAPTSGCRTPGGETSRRRRAVRLSRTQTRNHAYRSTETSRLQECSWQVCLLVGFEVSYERALRRTSFKVQTVKAGKKPVLHLYFHLANKSCDPSANGSFVCSRYQEQAFYLCSLWNNQFRSNGVPCGARFLRYLKRFSPLRVVTTEGLNCDQFFPPVFCSLRSSCAEHCCRFIKRNLQGFRPFSNWWLLPAPSSLVVS